MKTNKLTFKIHPREGRYRSFLPIFVDIKLKGKKCGQISEERGKGFRVGLTIKKEPTEQDPSPFTWVFFKHRIEGYSKAGTEAAKMWVVENWDKLIEGQDLYFFED